MAFKKILIVIFPIFLLAPTSAIADAESVRCSTFLDLEREINKTLPRKIDEVAELIQLSVTCETSTIKYTKRFLLGLQGPANTKPLVLCKLGPPGFGLQERPTQNVWFV